MWLICGGHAGTARQKRAGRRGDKMEEGRTKGCGVEGDRERVETAEERGSEG